MIQFSNMQMEEFLSLSAASIPPKVLQYIDNLSDKIEELKDEVQSMGKSEELAWEQVSFARDLVEQLDHFAENNLSKAKLEMYNQIRENTYFEV